MKHARKSKSLIVLCVVVAAGVAVEETVAQVSRQRSTSSRRSSLYSAPTGYQSQYSPYGGTYASPYGYQSDRRSSTTTSRYQDRRLRSQSSRYSERYTQRYSPAGGIQPQGVAPTRLVAPQQQGTEKEPGQLTPQGRPAARPGRTARPGAKPPTAPAETQVDVAKPTEPRAPAPGQRPPQPRAPAAQKQVKPQPQWPTFYLTVNADQIIVGDIFSVDVHLANPRKVGFDRLGVVLAYDAVFLRPVKGPAVVDETTPELAKCMIDEATDAPVPTGAAAAAGTKRESYIREAFSQSDRLSLYENAIDTGRGLITYMFELEDETATAQGPVASIYFEALQPTRRTFLSFRFAKEPTGQDVESSAGPGTQLTRDGKDILGLPLRPDDGTIDRGITILSEAPTKQRIRSLERSSVTEELYQTHLRLVPERPRIVVGEEFEVYVMLENPDHIRFDQISLLVAYNPRVLTVVDHDTDNTITSGVNIHDGSYRGSFPFDFFIANRVNLETGLIDYRMRGYRRPLFAEGVMACIRFHAIEATAKTTLRILVDYEGQDPTTGVFYRFHDVLADSADPIDGISTCSVQIGRLRSAAAERLPQTRAGG